MRESSTAGHAARRLAGLRPGAGFRGLPCGPVQPGCTSCCFHRRAQWSRSASPSNPSASGIQSPRPTLHLHPGDQIRAQTRHCCSLSCPGRGRASRRSRKKSPAYTHHGYPCAAASSNWRNPVRRPRRPRAPALPSRRPLRGSVRSHCYSGRP